MLYILYFLIGLAIGVLVLIVYQPHLNRPQNEADMIYAGTALISLFWPLFVFFMIVVYVIVVTANIVKFIVEGIKS